MHGVHRLRHPDRTPLWGTAALIAFTLGAVAVARTNGGAVVGADDSRLCYNSAGVGAACLPPPPADFEDVAIPSSAAPAKPAPPPAKPTTKQWAVGVAYGEGVQVTYQGRVYACLQPHTSQVDWSPVAAPALWNRVS